jgi:23S rRNA A2030 N6-methylase RlmJ
MDTSIETQMMNSKLAFEKEEQTEMKEVKELSGELKNVPVFEEEKQMTFVDKTYNTKSGLKKFLATLTPAQLAQAQVLVDDDTYVVFYPVVKTKRVRAHFDTGEAVIAERVDLCPQAVAEVSSTNNLSDASLTDEEKALQEAYAILLAGIKL